MIKSMFKWVLRLLLVLWWLVLALFVLKFYLDNSGSVDITLYQWTLTDIKLSVLAIILLLAGMAVMLLILAPWVLLLRMRIKRLDRKLSKTQISLQAVAQK